MDEVGALGEPYYASALKETSGAQMGGLGLEQKGEGQSKVRIQIQSGRMSLLSAEVCLYNHGG